MVNAGEARFRLDNSTGKIRDGIPSAPADGKDRNIPAGRAAPPVVQD
ncbi:hypothetical protein PACID_31850 [Acidipropionibacterium acidipropionici ATCC 4875]|uniref:Uncharacterized protein n=1 Tax=Acidipropionibacterium acidipropionici (strain ATCC 4875 / DSM 20272 / JCM 6432 / NBRC 12425 / NCIMB 8070 / 4) TaxID=1171373 RepID=K7SP13_ACIA4|nr:hypothetical protein PACID_31850 [Acidipropionibacterium acidipropionici ATCC 4875]